MSGRMTVEQAYHATMKYAGRESFDLVFTPKEDRSEIVNGEELPKWSDLILAA